VPSTKQCSTAATNRPPMTENPCKEETTTQGAAHKHKHVKPLLSLGSNAVRCSTYDGMGTMAREACHVLYSTVLYCTVQYRAVLYRVTLFTPPACFVTRPTRIPAQAFATGGACRRIQQPKKKEQYCTGHMSKAEISFLRIMKHCIFCRRHKLGAHTPVQRRGRIART